MKKILFLIFLFSICILAFSQSLEVTYHSDFTKNAADPQRVKSEQMILHIENGSSEFYSKQNQNRQELIAQLQKQGASFNQIQNELGKLPGSFLHFRIYKNYPQEGILTFTESLVMTNYKYEEKLEKPQWTLEKDTKVIIDYKCQKATAHFKGRTWTAWYTPEIPVQEGPWKLNGLPGLILEAQDSDNLYHFSAIGLKEITSMAISLPTRKYLDCTRKEYIQQKIECQKDGFAYLRKNTNFKIPSNMKQSPAIATKYIDIEIDEK